MIRSIVNAIVLFFCLFLFFMSDIFSYFLLESHTTYFLLGFLIAYYWYYQSLALMTTGMVLLATESFMIHESFFSLFISALPAFALIKAIKHRLYTTPFTPPITLGLALIIDLYLVKGLLKGLFLPPFYTIGILFVNMIIVLLFSLKLSGGKTRQSLMPFA